MTLPLIFHDDYMEDAIVYMLVMPILVGVIVFAKVWTVKVLSSKIEAENTHYTVLGISETATLPEIKKAFRWMAMKWHPDKNKSAEAEAMMKQLNAAHEVLKEADLRKVYDDELKNQSMATMSSGFRST